MTDAKQKPKGLSMRPVNLEAKGQLSSFLGKLKIDSKKKLNPTVVCHATLRGPESAVHSSDQSTIKKVSVQSESVLELPPVLPPKTKRSQSFSITDFDLNHEEKQMEIRDIEEELARDLFKTPTYARDIYSYLQTVEKRWQIPEDFLDSGEIKPKTRSILMDWFIQVQVYLELLDTTLHMAVMFVDRFLSIQQITASSLQLLGITCILIAAKYYERFPPQVADLVFLTDNTYKVNQVFTMERIVLRKFGFDLNSTDPVSTMEHFLQIANADRMTKEMAKYVLDLTITCHSFCSVRSTLIAAASVYTARRICVEDKAWTAGLEHFSAYTERDLIGCVKEMLRMLIQAPEAKLQAARKKHAASTFQRISHHIVLQSKPAEILQEEEEKKADM
ncbi:G2/mitotic-specific cyclin-B-like [Crassostrea virginica]